MDFDFPDNYTGNPEAILKKTRARPKKVSKVDRGDSQIRRSITPKFEAMANKSLRDFSASTTDNIRTEPQVNVGEDGFCGKTARITMAHVHSSSSKDL